MKTGRTLNELAQTLTAMRERGKDYMVPVERMKMGIDPDQGNTPTLILPTNSHSTPFLPSEWAHQQIATYADVPKAYYDRIKTENVKLFTDSVNHGFEMQHNTPQSTRMVRTFDGHVRAFLSSRYRRLDSYDLLEAVLPQLIENQFEVISADLTERRLYVNARTERITGEVSKNDIVQYGITISTSDVGAGALRVEPLLYRLVCLNGLITTNALRKYHLGKDQAVTDGDVFEMFNDDTKEMSDRAFWLQVRDLVTHTMKREVFDSEITKFQRAASLPITNFDVPEVVELASKHLGVTNEGVKQSVMAYLANGADGAGLTQWGLINSFTHAAQQDSVSYDDSMDLTRKAGSLIELTPMQWKTIATKAA
jgi:hypothetical protein